MAAPAQYPHITARVMCATRDAGMTSYAVMYAVVVRTMVDVYTYYAVVRKRNTCPPSVSWGRDLGGMMITHLCHEFLNPTDPVGDAVVAAANEELYGFMADLDWDIELILNKGNEDSV